MPSIIYLVRAKKYVITFNIFQNHGMYKSWTKKKLVTEKKKKNEIAKRKNMKLIFEMGIIGRREGIINDFGHILEKKVIQERNFKNKNFLRAQLTDFYWSYSRSLDIF